jgi:DNA-binding MarR family transcriptional regulator
MKPLIELISAWDAFSSGQPEGTVEAFCRHYLAQLAPPAPNNPAPELDVALAQRIGQLSSLHRTYSKLALNQLPGIELEWYYLLRTIAARGEVRKTEVWSYRLFLEPSTAIDMLNRLLKAGYLLERTDPADKRARLLRLTPEGEALLNQLEGLIQKASTLVYGDVSPAEKQSLLDLLTQLEARHRRLLQETRAKNLDELVR